MAINWDQFTQQPTAQSSNQPQTSQVDWSQFTKSEPAPAQADPWGSDPNGLAGDALQHIGAAATNFIQGHPKTGAIVGNLAAGGVNTFGRSIPQLGVSLLDTLHIINPDTAKRLHDSINKGADSLLPEAGNRLTGQPDVLSQAQEQNPTLSTGTRFGTELGLAAGAFNRGAEVGSLAQSVAKGVPTTASILGRAVGMGAANTSIGGDFTTGAVASPVFDLAGYGASQLGKRALNTQLVQDTLSNLSTAKKAAYDTLYKIPFAQETAAKAGQVADSIATSVKQMSGTLSPEQTKALSNVVSDLKSAQSTEDLHKLLLGFGSKGPGTIGRYFKGLETNTAGRELFTSTQQQIADVINSAATKAGAEDILNTAFNLNRTVKATNSVFNNAKNVTQNLEASPTSFNWKAADTKLNILINQYNDVPYMAKTVQTLQGLQKLTKQAKVMIKVGGLTTRAVGAAVGYKVGSKYGDGETGGAEGAVAGMLGTELLIKGIGAIAATDSGQAILRGLANPGIKTKAAGDVIKAIILNTANTIYPSQDNSNK